MKKFIPTLLFLLCFFQLAAQDSIAHRFSIGIEISPEFSSYKSKNQGYKKPNLFGAFGTGMGLGGVISGISFGLRTNFQLNDFLTLSSGIAYGKFGGRLNCVDPTIYYLNGNTLIPVSEIDSNYLHLNPEVKNCQVNTRTYESHYFSIPLLIHANLAPGRRFSNEIITGIQTQFRTNSIITDEISTWNDTAFYYEGSRMFYPEIDDEMKNVLFAFYIGMERRILIGDQLTFKSGWHFTRGLNNPVVDYSKYSMNKNQTDASFATNGMAVARKQKFHMNSFGFSFALNYSF